MPWPIAVDYPIVAIPDLHGQRASPEGCIPGMARSAQLLRAGSPPWGWPSRSHRARNNAEAGI